MRRTVTLIAAAAALAFSLTVASAGASTTKCAQYFCAHVEGTGLHVDYVQMYSDVPPGKTYAGFFTIYTNTGSYPYHHDTRWYSWSTPTYYVASHRYYSVKVNLNRNFANGTTLYIDYNKDGAYRVNHVSAVIHS